MLPDASSYSLRKNVKFLPGSLLGKYFFTSYQRTILASTGVLLGIVLLGQIIYSLPAIIAAGFNLVILFKIIVCYSPQAVTIILPLVASFGVFVAMRRQFDNHEILMARSFGAAEKQLLRVVQKLGLVLFFVLLLLKSYLARGARLAIGRLNLPPPKILRGQWWRKENSSAPIMAVLASPFLLAKRNLMAR